MSAVKNNCMKTRTSIPAANGGLALGVAWVPRLTSHLREPSLPVATKAFRLEPGPLNPKPRSGPVKALNDSKVLDPIRTRSRHE